MADIRSGSKILWGVGIAAIAGGIFMVRDIPGIDAVQAAGSLLLADSAAVFCDGQELESAVVEVFLGQSYLYTDGTKKEQDALILAENSRKEGAEEGTAVPDAEKEREEKADSAKQVSGIVQAERTNNAYVQKLKNSLDVEYLWKKFYIVDSTTSVTKDVFDVKRMLEMDFTMPQKRETKQILIYHTHGASEAFADSRTGRTEDSVVGVGTELAKELEKRGYGVYHDKTKYDWINGALDRSQAYNAALDGIQQILAKNPDIEVVIDLHRDSVGKGRHTYTTINGKPTAIVMFFNGMSRTRSGPITYLKNPNLEANLSFSLQLKCLAMEYYDGFTKPIYLKGYRYNLHVAKRALLIELGNENNTVEEAKNAAAPLADVLDKVLTQKQQTLQR